MVPLENCHSSLYSLLAHLAPLPCTFVHVVCGCVCDGICCCCALQPEEGWQADLQHMESLIDSRTKLIVINNPSNPCGSVYSQDHIKAMTDIAVRHRLPVLADEIYMGVQYGETPFHAVHVTNGEVPVIVCGGIGKRYMVPGWRVGWLVVFDRHNYFMSSVSYTAPPSLPAVVLALSQTHTSPMCPPLPRALQGVMDAIRLLAERVGSTATFVQAAVDKVLKDTPPDYHEQNISLLRVSPHATVILSLFYIRSC